MEKILSYYERQLEEIKGKLKKIQEKFTNITDAELAKAYLKCVSSGFDVRKLAPVFAELITRVEGKEYKVSLAELKTIEGYSPYIKEAEMGYYEFLAIMKPNFCLKSKDKNHKNEPIYNYKDSRLDFYHKYVALCLLEQKYSIYDFVHFYYEPRDAEYSKNKKDGILYNCANLSNKYDYIGEFLEAVIKYRIKNEGKQLSQDELYQLMEYYIKKYNPTPNKKREVTLKLN